MSEKFWQDIHSNNPKVIVHLYLVGPNNSSIEDGDVIGYFSMDVRKLSSSNSLHKIKLQGCSPAIVEVFGSIKTLPRRPSSSSVDDKEMSGLEKHRAKTVSPLSDMDALPIGPGSLSPEACTFCFTVNIRGASNLQGLVENMKGDNPPSLFWFSYSLFSVVVQTDRFSVGNTGDGPPPPMLFVPVYDTFLLRATQLDLANFFESMPALRIFLCTEGTVVAHADIRIGELFPCAALRQVPMEERDAGFETDCPLVSSLYALKDDVEAQNGGRASVSVGFNIKLKEIDKVSGNENKPDSDVLLPVVFGAGEGEKNDDVMASTAVATGTDATNTATAIPKSKQAFQLLPMQLNSIQIWISRANFCALAPNFTEGTGVASPVLCVGNDIVFSIVPMGGQGVAKVVERPTVVQTRVSSGKPVLSSGVSALLEFHPNTSTPPPESAILHIVATFVRRGKDEREIGRAVVHWPGKKKMEIEYVWFGGLFDSILFCLSSFVEEYRKREDGYVVVPE